MKTCIRSLILTIGIVFCVGVCTGQSPKTSIDGFFGLKFGTSMAESRKIIAANKVGEIKEKSSDKNKAIATDKYVQLFFSHPGKSSYLVVNGEAEIILDKTKIEELWTPVAKIWFKEGKDDPNISIIKVTPTTAYYWDTDGNKMINFIKMVASVVTGTNLVNGKEGTITL